MAAETVRIKAVKVLLQIIVDKRTLNQVLLRPLFDLSNKDWGLLQEIVYGVLRFYFRLDKIVSVLVEKPLKEKDKDLEIAIMIGLYQLEYMRVPEYAALATAVELGRSLNKSWSTGLINAVLRNYQKRKEKIEVLLERSGPYLYAHSGWMVKRIKQDWPQDYVKIFSENNCKAQQWLRVNTAVISLEGYCQLLTSEDIGYQLSRDHPTGLRLDSPITSEKLMGYTCGQVSIQDGASQLVTPLLGLGDGLRVLDACAAPGGKTAQMLEFGFDLACLLAVDKSEKRLETAKENSSRLHLLGSAGLESAEKSNKSNGLTFLVTDAKQLLDQYGEGYFDRILVDAPCSATGVIRRHPDIKLLRQVSDIDSLLQEQAELLAALWPLLKLGGVLLYSTCSIVREENVLQVIRFLELHDDAIELPFDADWGRKQEVGRQNLPGENAMDGFYIARLIKMCRVE